MSSASLLTRRADFSEDQDEFVNNLWELKRARAAQLILEREEEPAEYVSPATVRGTLRAVSSLHPEPAVDYEFEDE